MSEIYTIAHQLISRGFYSTDDVPLKVWRDLGFLMRPSAKLLGRLNKIFESESIEEAALNNTKGKTT